LLDGWKRLGIRASGLGRLTVSMLVLVFLMPGLGLADMTGHGGLVRSVHMSTDGTHALTASFDYSVRLWRFDEQSTAMVLEAHDGPVNAARFITGTDMAVSVGADGRVIFWSLSDGRPRFIRHGHAGRAMSVAIGPEGSTVLTGGWDGGLALWETLTGVQLKRIETRVPLVSVGFTGGGAILVAGDRHGILHLYRASDGVEIARRAAHEIGLTDMVIAEDGRRLLSIGLDNLARVWSLPDLDPIVEFLPAPEVKPVAIALSADRSSMLVGYIDGGVLHLDADTGALLREMRVDKAPVWAAAFSPDGHFALLADGSESVGVWHLATGDRVSVAVDTAGERATPWLQSDHPGARLFRKCANCHALSLEESQRSGPHFAGLFGREAGTVAGYRYSSALRGTGITWNRQSLRRLFELGPDKVLPGTKMPVQRVTDPAALDALIDYLEVIAPRR
jgi:cytochrome c